MGKVLWGRGMGERNRGGFLIGVAPLPLMERNGGCSLSKAQSSRHDRTTPHSELRAELAEAGARMQTKAPAEPAAAHANQTPVKPPRQQLSLQPLQTAPSAGQTALQTELAAARERLARASAATAACQERLKYGGYLRSRERCTRTFIYKHMVPK